MKRNLFSGIFCLSAVIFFGFLIVTISGCGSGGNDNAAVNKSGTAAVVITSATRTVGDRITGTFIVVDADTDNPSAVFTTAETPSGFSMLQTEGENQRRKVAECWPVDELVRDDENPLFWGFIPSQTGDYQFAGYISDGKGGETDFEFPVQVEEFSVSCDLYGGENENVDYILRIFSNSSSAARFRIYWIKGDVPEGQIAAGDFVADDYRAPEYNLGRLLEKQDYSCKVVAYNNPDQFGENLVANFYKKFTTVAINVTAPDPNTVVLRDPNNYQVFPTFVVGYDFVVKKTAGEIVARNLPAIFSADAQAHFTTSPLAFAGDCNEWDPNQSDYLQIGADGTVVVKVSDHDATHGTKGFNFALINEGSAWDWALWYNMKPADVKMLIRPRNDGSVSFGYILLPDGSINIVAEGAATN